MSSTEIELASSYQPASVEAVQIWADEMQGAPIEFLTVTTPTAGGTTWEVEGEEPTKAIRGVVVDDYEAHALYLQDYSGESNPPDGYWIAGVCQYITDEARAAGYNENSHTTRGGRVSNRQVLYIARPGELVPIRIDLSGASVRPWRLFKQNQIVNIGRRVAQAVVELTLESKKYKSGYSGSVLTPKVLGFLPDDVAAGYLEQREQLRPFTRVRSASNSPDGGFGDDAPTSTLASEFSAVGVNVPVADDDNLPF